MATAGSSSAPNLLLADLFHWWGQDLALSPSGDLQTVDSLPKDRQRILRRLCTNGALSGVKVGEYFFHTEFGGSAPWYVGQSVDPLVLQGVIRQQMYLEPSVSHSPEPEVDITTRPDGSFTADINFTDVQTGQPVPPLTMDVTS